MSVLLRLLLGLLAVVVLLAVVGGLLWFLAYGVSGPPPDRADVPGLGAEATILWGDHGDVTIRAASPNDALAALGFAHGQARAWSVALWRQAALGRLGEWFGEAALPLDELALRLGLAEEARAAYETLADSQRARLRAYAGGLDAALGSGEGGRAQEFVLLGIEPEGWEPWHTLALERLFAWLATAPPDAPTPTAAPVRAFYDADAQLRRWLRLHGFENNIAWTARDSTGTLLFHRIVYGATALPFLLEADLHVAGRRFVAGASLPGTPFFPSGRTDEHAWALLMSGRARLTRAAWDSARVQTKHERLRLPGEDERLFRFELLGDVLPLEQPRRTRPDSLARADSVWAIAWPGRTAGTDLGAWLGLAEGRPDGFRLLQGSGLWLGRDGSWRVLGTPAVRTELPGGLFAGESAWARYAAELLQTQDAAPADLQRWITDAYSVWAAEQAPPLVAALGRTPLETPALRDALTYLRNWDFSYDEASIAASIFDTWLAFYRDTTNTLPVLPADSAAALSSLQRATFEKTVAYLLDRLGPDLRQWRWEHISPDRRLFPIWSAEEIDTTLSLKAQRRFAPLELPGRGHPSALAWGPSPLQATLAAPAAWEGWLRTDNWDQLMVRRRQFDPYEPLGRYLASDRPPAPLALPDSTEVVGTTRLRPAR